MSDNITAEQVARVMDPGCKRKGWWNHPLVFNLYSHFIGPALDSPEMEQAMRVWLVERCWPDFTIKVAGRRWCVCRDEHEPWLAVNSHYHLALAQAVVSIAKEAGNAKD